MFIFKIACITKKIVLKLTSYGSYFFLGGCFAKSVLNSKGPLQGLWFEGSFLGCLVIGSCFIPKKESLADMIIRFHLLSIIATRCTISSILTLVLSLHFGSHVRLANLILLCGCSLKTSFLLF